MAGTVLPAAADFTGASVTEGEFKTALTDMRTFLDELLGNNSSGLIQIDGPAGTVAAPGITVGGELDCGLYLIGANNVGFSVNGAKVLDIATTGLTVTGTITGTVALATASTAVTQSANDGSTKVATTAYADAAAATIAQQSKSAAYTTVLADAGKHIYHPSSDNNARTFTIDSNANVAYPIGTTLTFVNEINTVTIAITSNTLTLAGTGSTGSRTLAANGIATALKVSSTKWVISGVGLT